MTRSSHTCSGTFSQFLPVSAPESRPFCRLSDFATANGETAVITKKSGNIGPSVVVRLLSFFLSIPKHNLFSSTLLIFLNYLTRSLGQRLHTSGCFQECCCSSAASRYSLMTDTMAVCCRANENYHHDSEVRHRHTTDIIRLIRTNRKYIIQN